MAGTEVIVNGLLRAAGLVALLVGDVSAQVRSQLYDVKALVFKETQFLPGHLGPLIDRDAHPWGSEEDSPIAGLELGDLVSNLKEATDPLYWGQEGVQINAEDSGFLEATCGDAMHQRIAALLAGLESYELEHVTVELHFLPGELVRTRPAILGKDELEALLVHAEPHPVLVGRVRIGGDILLGSTQHRAFVHAIDMKAPAGIEQLATSPDPVVDYFALGTSWRVQTRRMIAGYVLVSIDGSKCEVLTADDREVPANNGKGQTTTKLRLPHYREFGGDATVMLRDGEGLLFGSNQGDGRACCLRIRRPHPVADPFTDAPTGPQLLCLRSYPVRHICFGYVSWPGILHWSGLYPEVEEDPQPAIVDEGRLVDMIKSTIAPYKWDGAPFAITPQGGILLVRADEPTQKLVADKLDVLGRHALRRFGVEVRYGRIDAKSLPADLTSNLEGLAERLPMCFLGVNAMGGGFRFDTGTYTTYVRDFDPVIAGEAVAAQPVVDRVHEGASVSVKVVPAGANRARLYFGLGVSELAGPIEHLQFEDPRFGQIDLPKMNWNRYRAEPVIDLDRWNLLHVSPIEGTDEHLAIVIRVSDL